MNRSRSNIIMTVWTAGTATRMLSRVIESSTMNSFTNALLTARPI